MSGQAVNKKQKKQTGVSKGICFLILCALLFLLFFYSINTGGIHLSFSQLIRGLFFSYDEQVAIVYDLRFPRIFIAMLSGAALAVSGVLFQAVMRNPLADPGIIGVSSGASFTAVAVVLFFPRLFFLSPFFAFLGGILSFLLVYLLSWKSGPSPLRLILVGVAVNSVFSGILEGLAYFTGGKQTGAAAMVNANLTMKTWQDVHILWIYVAVGLIAAFCIAKSCNLLALEEKTVRNLGISVIRLQITVAMIAVLLASISTAVSGVISFVGLIGPHMARIFVGSDHRTLIPFSMLLGSFCVLLADTTGRVIFYPHEIPASIVLAVVGGPFFIFLLVRGEKTYGN